MYQQMYNYGSSSQPSTSLKEESHEVNKNDTNRNTDTMFYHNSTQPHPYPINTSFSMRYPSFDSNSFDHTPSQEIYASRNQDHASIATFHDFHAISSSQDIVASLTNAPMFDHVETSHTSTITTTATVLPPLNTTPIVMAPLQHHPAASHQTYLLAHKKPLKGSPRPSRERAPWTPEEDNLLKLAVQLYGDKTEKWAKIAACVPGRTNKNCRKRWFHSLDPSLRKGAWTEEEDQLLREGVSKFPNQWSKIADMLPGRTDDQCAKRWRESLDPSIDRSDWTAMEDSLLMEKYEEYGSQWQKIAFFFDGRPGLHCRNRWRKLQRMVQVKKDKEGTDAPFYNTLAEGGRTLRFQHTNSASLASHSKLTIAEPPKETPLVHLDHHPHDNTTSNTTSSYSQLTSLLSHPQQQQQQQHDPSVLVQFTHTNTPVVPDDFDEYGHGIKPYGCDVPGCYAVFAASAGLFYHMKNSHPNLEGIDKPYRCAMVNCQKKYKNINGLQYHIKDAKGTTGHGGNGLTGEDDRPYRCMIGACKKAYRTASGFRYHQRNGHNIQPTLNEHVNMNPTISPPLQQTQPQAQFRMKREKWVLESV